MLKVDYKNQRVLVENDDGSTSEFPFASREAFHHIAQAYLRVGWDTKYVYSFSWLGRPIIQLPDDMLRIQEVIYEVKPDVIVETGVAHGGSLIFYASLFKSMGNGRVVGVDIEIRPHNRAAIESHELANYISLVEGSSTSASVIDQVRTLIDDAKRVMVVLDSNHSKAHVLAELAAYANLVSPGSYIIVCDGIMKHLQDAPRTQPDWSWNNPVDAIEEFIEKDKRFSVVEPMFPFNEGLINERVTYWPSAFLKRVS